MNYGKVRAMGKGRVQGGEDGLDRDFAGRFLETDLHWLTRIVGKMRDGVFPISGDSGFASIPMGRDFRFASAIDYLLLC